MTSQLALQSVLQLRRSKRDDAKWAVTAAQREYEMHLAADQQLSIDRERMREAIRRTIESEACDASEMLMLQRHAEYLGREAARQLTISAESKASLSVLRQNLVKADQSVQIIEKIAERQRLEDQLAKEKSAARESDEMAISHWRMVSGS